MNWRRHTERQSHDNYLPDDDLMGLKRVVEVSIATGNVAHQQLVSMTRSCSFKTAPECQTISQPHKMLKYDTYIYCCNLLRSQFSNKLS
jgi:hypothetical protein